VKILLPFKRVVDPYEPATALVPSSTCRCVVNPFDEVALEQALLMREAGMAEELTAVTIGPDRAEEQVRRVLALGIERVIHVRDDRLLDSYAVSRLLRVLVKRVQPDLVLMGKQASDDDACQTGQMLAGLLGWPQVTFVSALRPGPAPACLECVRETDRGLETVRVRCPAVITVDLHLNRPRLVPMAGLLKARRTPYERITSEELDPTAAPATTVVDTRSPPPRPAGQFVKSVEELVEKLRSEAKVL